MPKYVHFNVFLLIEGILRTIEQFEGTLLRFLCEIRENRILRITRGNYAKKDSGKELYFCYHSISSLGHPEG